MALIECEDGKFEVPGTVLEDLKYGWCPFCEPEDSNVRRQGKGYHCNTCDSTFYGAWATPV